MQVQTQDLVVEYFRLYVIWDFYGRENVDCDVLGTGADAV